MRVLFSIRHPGYVRNFESLLRELARRGHSVHIAVESNKSNWLDGFNPLDPLVADHPELTYEVLAPRVRDGWSLLTQGVRQSLDYLRYLEPRYRDAPRLRERAATKLPAAMRRFPGLRLRPVRALVRGVLRLVEPTLPRRARLDELLEAQQPDVLLVTPYVAMGSDQVDYVRSARERAIPTVYCVTSWDNLTNKGLIREQPDLVAVWNEAQRREAIELHGTAPERVVATGAHSYDHWFGWRAATTRDEFCARIGLRPEQKLVLYLCSSVFVAPGKAEAEFVRRWIAALRADAQLRDVGVLVRPHPQNFPQWATVELGPQTAIWPRRGADPVDDSARADYFDSIHHAAAVVGVNTSGLIESAIVGRPTLTVLDPAFHTSQTGTLHFEHIAGSEGTVTVAGDLGEHVEQLAAVLGRGGDDMRLAAFVDRFVRPHGRDVAAAALLADAIERAAAYRVRASGRRPAGSLLRLALAPAAAACARADDRARATRRVAKGKKRMKEEVAR